MHHLPTTLKIKDIVQESSQLRTYVFGHSLKSRPGQFVMVWIPQCDEKPMSIGYDDGQLLKIGIAKVGPWTTKLFNEYKVGDRLGIRGPYGTTFDLKEHKRIAMIGGGFGTPPLVFLADEARKKGIEVDFIEGARNKELLIYLKELKKMGAKIHVSTDDGSEGFKGYAPQLLENRIKEGNKYDCVYTCGPEVMMVKVAQIAEDYGIESQISLERFMKCGFGLCGACCMDDTGIRACVEGPVISGTEALRLPEFGHYTRDCCGNRTGH